MEFCDHVNHPRPCTEKIIGFRCGHYTTHFIHMDLCSLFRERLLHRISDELIRKLSEPLLRKLSGIVAPSNAFSPLLHRSYRSDPQRDEVPQALARARYRNWEKAAEKYQAKKREQTEELMGEWWECLIHEPRRAETGKNIPIEKRVYAHEPGKKGDELLRLFDMVAIFLTPGEIERICSHCKNGLYDSIARKLPCDCVVHEGCFLDASCKKVVVSSIDSQPGEMFDSVWIVQCPVCLKKFDKVRVVPTMEALWEYILPNLTA
ncbi:hypothetical protein B0J14DRAFT_558418 [Halenospora varia]|nr:hypothetical protein B0J14DRAFT_558418 [Halenospora varia]